MTTNGSPGGGIRVGAVVLGTIGLVVMMLATAGGALIALVAVGAAHLVQRQRGHRLTRLQGWLTAAVTSAIAVIVGGGLFMSHRLTDGQTMWHHAQDAVQQASQEQMRHPRPPPAFLRGFPGAAAPQPMPMTLTTPLAVVSLIFGAEFLGLLYGSLTWAAAWLVLYGVRGPRSTDHARIT